VIFKNFLPTDYNKEFTDAFETLMLNKSFFGSHMTEILVSKSIDYLMLNSLFNNLDSSLKSIQTSQDLQIILHLISDTPLFGLIISDSIIYNLAFEKLLTNLRKTILIKINCLIFSDLLSKLIQNLALNSLNNEYIFYESHAEIERIKNLEKNILDSFFSNNDFHIFHYLILSMYRKLSNFDWFIKIKINNCSKNFVDNFINYPLEEKKIIKGIKNFKQIENKTSLKVKIQYEKNPYPTWNFVNISSLDKKMEINNFIQAQNINFISSKNQSHSKKSLLIAGSGTGREVINYSLLLNDCNIIAIDLCNASLAYAIRKSREYNVKNVTFLNGDILDLKSLNMQFDYIVSSGVLHHMENPLDGWITLRDVLKKNGLMRISLYSKIARSCINNIRNEVAQFHNKNFNEILKKYRNSLIESNNLDFQNLKTFNDFYSTSALRDLIAHVREHQFSIPQIEDILHKLQLDFCGFADVNNSHSIFESYYGSKIGIFDLKNWVNVEKNNPETFKAMYQFWLQKN
jgi:ubiquinone/menaquinone biosynthesis C-methylase UbiE